jgi:hypothetical protein
MMLGTPSVGSKWLVGIRLSDVPWWSQRTPAVSPPARDRHALAYDAARQRVILFGGSSFGAAKGDDKRS